MRLRQLTKCLKDQKTGSRACPDSAGAGVLAQCHAAGGFSANPGSLTTGIASKARLLKPSLVAGKIKRWPPWPGFAFLAPVAGMGQVCGERRGKRSGGKFLTEMF
jgi:hypothetical protein